MTMEHDLDDFHMMGDVFDVWNRMEYPDRPLKAFSSFNWCGTSWNNCTVMIMVDLQLLILYILFKSSPLWRYHFGYHYIYINNTRQELNQTVFLPIYFVRRDERLNELLWKRHVWAYRWSTEVPLDFGIRLIPEYHELRRNKTKSRSPLINTGGKKQHSENLKLNNKIGSHFFFQQQKLLKLQP